MTVTMRPNDCIDCTPIDGDKGTTAYGYARQWVRRCWAWFLSREEKRRSRQALADLTDDQLRDIGVTAQEARDEAQAPYWR